MKKVILLILGLFVAGIAAYSIPKEVKTNPFKIFSGYHISIADQSDEVSVTPVPYSLTIRAEEYSPGNSELLDLIKPISIETNSRMSATNRGITRYLARSYLTNKAIAFYPTIQDRSGYPRRF